MLTVSKLPTAGRLKPARRYQTAVNNCFLIQLKYPLTTLELNINKKRLNPDILDIERQIVWLTSFNCINQHFS